MASGGDMGSWVPQLFYDLIARVTPGFITCATFLMIYIITPNTQQITNCIELANDSFLCKKFPTTFVIIAGYAISYITGFLLRGIYSICVFFREDFDKKYIEDYNKIKFSDDKVGSRLSKLRAEIHMCTVLGMGWIFAYLFFLYRTLAITPKIFNCAQQFLALFIFSGLIVALIRNLIRNYHRILCTVLGMGWIFAYMLFLYRTLAITPKIFNCAQQFLALVIFSGLIVTLIRNYHRISKIFYTEIDHYKQYKGIPEDETIVEKLNTERSR
jgi:Na+-transporting methylmalonyl-CoA/oxaloacetate decarboxylase gamma subunit